MEYYWKNTFTKNLNEKKNHTIYLYKYKLTNIALISTSEFYKYYSHELQKIGIYNENLTEFDENKKGWLFKLKDQTKLNDILKDIIEENVEPSNNAKTPIYNSNQTAYIYTSIFGELKDLIKNEEKELYIIKKKDFTQYIHINSKLIKEGDLVFKFECSKGKIEIYQKRN